MVVDLEPRCPPGGTLRMIHEEEGNKKYCYPFKEYDPSSASNTGTRNGNIIGSSNSSRPNRPLSYSEVSDSVMRRGRGTLNKSQGKETSHYANLNFNQHNLNMELRGSRNDMMYYQNQMYTQVQNLPPPPPPEIPPPLPPRRTTSLFGGGSATLTLLRIPKPRESTASSLNPKRISIATSSFWNGHPDMPHFASGWELGHNSMRTQSVWGTTERGGRPVTEESIWGDPPAVKKGVLLQQRDKLWSRWKERYFILTRDYLNCFRRTTSVHRSGVRLSEMGSFIYKLRLAEVEGVEWETRKSCSMIALILPQEPKILLRVPGDNYEALHQWYTLLQECIYMSKERRRALRSQHGSMLRSTTSYNPNASKSTGSASPNSSSTKSSSNSKLSASNSDLACSGSGGSSDGEIKCESNKKNSISRSGSGLLAIRKISGGSSPRSFLREKDNGKYSPLIDDEEEDDYEEAPPSHIPPPVPKPRQDVKNSLNTNINYPSNECIDANEEFKVTLRRRREINNNCNGNHHHGSGGIGLPTSWRLSLAQPTERERMNEMNVVNLNSSVRVRGQQARENSNGNGYATPLDVMVRPPGGRIEPPSWTPQPPSFQRTSSLVPSQWVNNSRRDNYNNAQQITPNGNLNGYGSGRGNNNFNARSSIMYCPSRITPDVTFRKL